MASEAFPHDSGAGAERRGGTAFANQAAMKSSSWSLLLAMVACGAHPQGWGDGPPAGGAQGYGDDAGVVGPVAEAGSRQSPPKAPSDVYPAFPVDVAQVQARGGPILSSPVIVTITWTADPDAATYEAFGDVVGASSYWHAINSEYGVGSAASAPPITNHVRITSPPPAQLDATDIDPWISNATSGALPSYTPDTIYTVYLPAQTTFLYGGQDACQVMGGYHEETPSGVLYAVMPHCPGFQVTDIVNAASHELNEAATDPHPNTAQGYNGFDPNHVAFNFIVGFGYVELGDACETSQSAWDDTTDLPPFAVQRQWSNKSAAAGHDWCVPSIDGYMYNTTFLPSTQLDDITVDLTPLGMDGDNQGTVQTKGFRVALGESRTFPIGFFSDRPLDDPIRIAIVGGTGEMLTIGTGIANGAANVSLDRTQGLNGDVAHVTVSPTAFNPLGVVFLEVEATLPGSKQRHVLPFLVSQN